MECVNCTQCIDACDGVMTKIGRPTGLIRYSSQRRLDGDPRRTRRVRLIAYPLLLAGFVSALVALLLMRADAAITQMRTPGVAYTVRDDGAVASPLRMRLDNRLDRSRRFAIESLDPSVALDGAHHVEVAANDSAEVLLKAVAPRSSFAGGHRSLEIRARDGEGRSTSTSVRLIGPLDLKAIGGTP